MLNILTKSLKTGVLTEANPFGTQPAFGFPVIDFERCTACEECARVCPTAAISTEVVAPGRRTLTLSAPLESLAGRRQFLRARLTADDRVETVAGPGSHLVAALAAADVLIDVPAEVAALPAGAPVDTVNL